LTCCGVNVLAADPADAAGTARAALRVVIDGRDAAPPVLETFG
jgi:hypothetical protein